MLAVAGGGIAADPAAELASAKRLLLQVSGGPKKLRCVQWQGHFTPERSIASPCFAGDYSLLFPTHCAGARCSFDKQTAVATAEAWPEEAVPSKPVTVLPKDLVVDVETEDRHIL